MQSLNIELLRQDTPGCQHVLHFNNAGASLSPNPVINAVKNHIDLESLHGGYEAARIATDRIQNFYKQAALLINCDEQEIAFLENATRAWDMAFYSLQLQPGDKILTSVCEYASNYLAFLHRAKKTGVMIDVIANDESGQLDLHSLERKLDKHVKLIAITHVPTQGGLINPAQGVGKLANQHNIPFLLDATQSVGQMPIDVQSLQCDFLCATGRKYLRGPRGTGFLYIKKNRIEQCDPPFVDLHSATWSNDNDYILRDDALRFETWEQNIAAKIGLGEAIRYALRLGLPAIWQRIEYLSTVLRQQLLQTDGIVLHDQGKNKCGIVTFTSNKKTPEEIQQALAERNINVSVSLQEYARLDLAKRNLPALVRASVHYYNIEEEVAHFCDAIKNFSL